MAFNILPESNTVSSIQDNHSLIEIELESVKPQHKETDLHKLNATTIE